MAIKLRRTLFTRFLLTRWGKALLGCVALVLVAGLSVFTYFYVKFAAITDEKLKAGPFANMSVVYAAPRPVMLGDSARADEIADYLRRCQYSESNSSRIGWYKVRPDGIEVNPGPDAYDQEGAVIKIAGGKVTEIISLADHTSRTQYLLEPELVTNLFDRKREKRRIVHYDEIPQAMVDAVLSAEDQRFFQHPGVDPFGLIRAVFVDIKDRRYEQGSSTITMQLARTLLLTTERSWKRKAEELLITLHLEQKLTKKQIFEYYANSIYLGNQGSFSINGFGEGAQVYFGKDLSKVTLPEAAMLAGRIQSERWDPFLHPDQAKARRNLVLRNMRDNGKITPREFEEAAASTLKVTRGTTQSSEAPYFVDLLKEELAGRFQDRDFQNDSYRIYSTLDMNLQHDAEEAMKVGIQETDAQWHRRSKAYGTEGFPRAQAAMIVLDAETGELKALVGGRDYGVSQLNHALSKRQPGSSFKPFVYTAAMETALDGNNGGPVLTPASTVVDEPTTFWFEQQPPWTPNDFEGKFEFRPVTLREALAHSMNVPAVKVAEMVGYDKVEQVARKVGMNLEIKPTPSIALGTYEVTPLEIARAYTVFPNGGQLLETSLIKSIRDRQSSTIFEAQPKRRQAIDPRVAYLVLSMMEEVLRSGTGASVASRGFALPGCGEVLYACAAGKTGTNVPDGWFAGFTSKLICIVWVGFDDNRDFKLEGAHSALPIWVEFMKRAHLHREYRNVHPFEAPDGIVTVDIDSDTGELATSRCPHVRSEVFIAGTQPVQTCRLHGDGRTQVAGWEPLESQPASQEVRPVADARVGDPGASRVLRITPAQPAQQPTPQKKGIFGRILDLFK